MDETNQDIIQVRDPKEIPYSLQLTLMRQSIESRSQGIRGMARALNFQKPEMNDLIENMALEIDKNIRQTAELALLLSTESEREIREEIKELKREIEKLKE
jgi:hypothetical protein